MTRYQITARYLHELNQDRAVSAAKACGASNIRRNIAPDMGTFWGYNQPPCVTFTATEEQARNIRAYYSDELVFVDSRRHR